jgi:hypothetical protein
MEVQQILDLNKQITDSEKHFNNMQNEYRKIGSGWLLATFAGLGFALTHKDSLPFNHLILIALICYAGAIGMIMLWNMDLSVYQKLLDANFKEGLLLEKQHPWIPQIRHNMLEFHGNRGVLPRVIWFYSMPILVLFVIAACQFTLFHSENGFLFKTGIWVIHFLLYSSFSYFSRHESRVWKKN